MALDLFVESFRGADMASGCDRNRSDYGGLVNPWPEILALLILVATLVGVVVYRVFFLVGTGSAQGQSLKASLLARAPSPTAGRLVVQIPNSNYCGPAFSPAGCGSMMTEQPRTRFALEAPIVLAGLPASFTRVDNVGLPRTDRPARTT